MSTCSRLPSIGFIVLSLFFSWIFAGLGYAQDEAETDSGGNKNEEKDLEITLEKLFPEKGMFGPSARSAAVSADGKYAVWLYKPYVERRHGNDLWLFEFETGKSQRVTSVAVMAHYQSDTEEVKADRIEKAKKKAAEKKKQTGETKESDAEKEDDGKQEKKSDNEQNEEEEFTGNEVDEDDADKEDAPRYGGISSFRWSPKANELLFSSDGDVYKYVVESGKIDRLTKTRDRERNVQFLPDGSGFTYQLNDALLRATFGDHFVEQLDPELPRGQGMRGYRLSPDGTRLVFLASSRRDSSDSDRTVNIATYRDRFMKVREVPRRVSDDPIADVETSVYLYRLPSPDVEDGELVRVYTYQRTGPRDILQVPDWAPDSSKVAFAAFEQSSSQVHILEASFPEKDSDETEEEDKKESDSSAKEVSRKNRESKKESNRHKSDDGFVDHPAQVVYRFLHNGGPTTPRMINPRYLADSRRLIFLTEQSGFRHLHVLDPTYESLEQITRGHFEVYPMEMPEHRKWAFATATKEHSSRLDVYRIDPDGGSMRKLTPAVGSYSNVAVSPGGEHVLANFVSYGSLRELVHVDVKAQTQTALTNSHPKAARTYTRTKPELFEYENRRGQRIQGMMFKPKSWKKDGQFPLLVYVYGGPLGTRKQVNQGNYSSAAYFFAWYMAEKHGYLTCTIDPRGMSGYGALFEKANYEQVGVPQVEDLTDGVKYLLENYAVDPERVAIHGWSFGGFQTQMCLYTEPGVFKVGIAGAGPTEWENYNSWYSTGTIGPSREGKTDLDKYSLLPMAKNLEGKLLLVHGMEDSNVLFQDTVRVYAELLEAGKEAQVELFLDPTGGHGLGGQVKSLGRYRKYEEFLLRTMGQHETAKDAEEDTTVKEKEQSTK